MGDEERSGSLSDVDLWDRLLSEQTALFKKTTVKNKALEARVEELERELLVWKVAFKASEDERDAYKKTVTTLERNIGSFKEDNPLILCLIDGDGNIFAPELISNGNAGGHHAARLLSQGIAEHMAANGGMSGRGQLWLTIYCNKKGLSETLTNNNVCTTEQFEEFFMGFNQANPLFSCVDVGVGKEAADSKIKECLRVFTRFPQTSRVYFGGSHDNGYTSTLNQLQNEGLHTKLTILRGYKDLAYELKSLNLPHLDIKGLFMTKKLPTTYKKPAQATAKDIDNVMKQVTNSMAGSDNVQPRPNSAAAGNGKQPQSQLKGPRLLVPGLPLYKHKPPPCNFFYLANCTHGNNCRYAHDYELAPDRILELRTNALKWPCPYINSGQRCPQGFTCCMAHRCPHGPRCFYVKQQKCKFTGKGMHETGLPAYEYSEKYLDSLIPTTAQNLSTSSTSSFPFRPLSPIGGGWC